MSCVLQITFPVAAEWGPVHVHAACAGIPPRRSGVLQVSNFPPRAWRPPRGTSRLRKRKAARRHRSGPETRSREGRKLLPALSDAGWPRGLGGVRERCARSSGSPGGQSTGPAVSPGRRALRSGGFPGRPRRPFPW
ncbi:hypothetical protein NDU88_002110 [Pleurodeles waltl]|uniref:Uncharacterized protein n=1 Tax=Pleurodeles waltl TaxID=8319 RepID=A0AAV7Q526_PLEWA|nr:hypothetical protein NDU88_002110 [Pleurodeles waltl]